MKEGREGGREGVSRSCDIAAAARLRISVFHLEGERESKERRDRQRVWCVALSDKL